MQKILYLGLHAPEAGYGEILTHLPIIQIIPVPHTHTSIQRSFANLHNYTHIIFTSQSSVPLFFDYADRYNTSGADLVAKTYLAVGAKTAAKLHHFHASSILVAANETAEGITEILAASDLTNATFFWPHSALARPVIKEWLERRKIPHCACVFYDTLPHPGFPKPDLSSFDEIVFTSPSTINAFLTFYNTFPKEQKLRFIGPITKHHFDKLQAIHS